MLLPSPDLEESLQILNQRQGYVSDGNFNINEHFLRHPSNYELAKFMVYTKGKTPAETCRELLDLIQAEQT
ncbi:MAG: hypothetical protein HC922_07275 [Leptolyngbyaceae cyanobacterium SM2_3_12]|nr:hypothetical protein [Leptolyngbyaceae cyanobacterium SM2_3_12]